MPFYNYRRLKEENDLRQILKEYKEVTKEEEQVLSEIESDLSYQMIDVFGVGKSYRQRFKLTLKLDGLQLKYNATGDRTLLTEIIILRKQLENIKDEKATDLYELERIINRHYKMTLDTHKTSVRQVYGYLEDINKQIQHERSNNRKGNIRR